MDIEHMGDDLEDGAEVVTQEESGNESPSALDETAEIVELEDEAGLVRVDAGARADSVETRATVLAHEPAVEPEPDPQPESEPAPGNVSADVLPRRRFPMPRLGRRAAIVLAIVFLFAFSGVAYATYDYDQAYNGKILPGIELAGVDVGGMTRAEALAAVHGASRIQLDRSIEVSWEKRSWHVTPRKLGARSDAEQLVDEAIETSQNTNVFKKASMAVLADELSVTRDLGITYPRQGVRGFVEGVASSLDRDPIDAAIDYSSGWVELTPAQEGRKVVTSKTRLALNRALRKGGDSVELRVKITPATETGQNFDQILLLRIGENKLYLYEDGKITHSWTVATGLPEYPTPTGLYEITEKRYLPTWVNPDPTGWGASMPASIPPGPGNPLGTRALNWSASGIRFHGTEATYSLGYNASHGCIRMAMSEVEQLYDLVDVGTPIVSLIATSPDPLYAAAPDPSVVEADAGDSSPSTDSEGG